MGDDSALALLLEPLRPYSMLLAGAFFGAGWWVWADVLVRASLVAHAPVGFAAHLPGIFATLGVLLMATVPRDDDDGGYLSGYGDDDAAEVRRKSSTEGAACAMHTQPTAVLF